MTTEPSTPLKQHVSLQRGTTYKSSRLGQPGPVLLGLSSIARDGGFRGDSLKTYGGDSPEKLLVRPGELYAALKDVTQSGDLLGAVARVPRFIDAGRLTQDTVKLTVTSDIRTDYLYWILRTPQYREYCRSHAMGTTNLSLSREDFLSFSIPSPTVGRISLIEALAALEDRIAVNERIAATVLELAQSIFDEASRDISDGPAMFPDLAEIYGGGTPRTAEPAYWDGMIPWTTPTDVTALKAPYLFATKRMITKEGLENCHSGLYPAGSIFMTSRATIGAFAIPQMPAAVNQGFIVVVPRRPEMRWWLLHEMRAKVDTMLNLANGSTFLEISRKNFKNIAVRKPSKDLLLDFHRRADSLHERAAVAMVENASLAELRDTLLARLMSGEIRIRDAERVVEEAT